ncbi:hypothetical protein [Saccharopolyspora shandongensis]|uniref:hypothetical protein n=1 Tax=Saccharopolyspora shandongensis TaxID=418495 RepID=UPI0033EC6CD3
MRLRRMRHPIDVQPCDPRLRADQKNAQWNLRIVGMSRPDTPTPVDDFPQFQWKSNL